MQHRHVGDPPRQALHQLGVRNGVEVLGDIRIDDLSPALGQLLMDQLHRLVASATGSVPMRRVAEVGLEYRLQDELCGRLRNPIFQGRDAQRAFSSSWFRNQYPAHCLGLIGPRLQLTLQLLEPAFLAIFLNLFEGLSVDSRCPTFLLREPQCLRQDVASIDFVVQRVEAKRRLCLGLRVQLSLKLFELCLGW